MKKLTILILLFTLLTPGCYRRKTKVIRPSTEGLKTGVWDESKWDNATWG